MKNESAIKELFANIGKIITSSLKIEEVIEGIMAEIRDYFNPENWSLLRLDPNTNKLFFSFVKGIDIDRVKKVKLGLGEGIAGSVAQTGESVFVADTSSDQRFTDRVDRISGFFTKSIIAVPLRFQGRVYGVIEIINREDGVSFTEDEHLVLQTIADFSAIALANASLYEEATAKGENDPLTGLYNIRKLNEFVKECVDVSISRRCSDDIKEGLRIYYIDLNDFKNINDKYGHRTGDKALRIFSLSLRSLIRSDDLLFRTGGDEFLIIARDYSGSLYSGMDRIEKALSNLTVRDDSIGISIDFSYGISYGPVEDIERLIDEADRDMYGRKRSKKTMPEQEKEQ